MDNQQKVFGYIDSHRREIVDFLKQMVSFPTINDGDSDGNELPLQNFLAEKLKEEQFDRVVTCLLYTSASGTPAYSGPRPTTPPRRRRNTKWTW